MQSPSSLFSPSKSALIPSNSCQSIIGRLSQASYADVHARRKALDRGVANQLENRALPRPIPANYVRSLAFEKSKAQPQPGTC